MEENTFIMAYDAITGKILGFYPKRMLELYDEIPTPNIEITDMRHQYYMEHNGYCRINPETLVDELIELPIQPYVPSLEEKNRADIDYISIMLGVDL